MAITFVGSAHGNAINGAGVTLTLPGGLLQNDIVIFIGGAGDTGAVGPGTYTSIYNVNITQLRFIVSYKIMGATPDTTVALTGAASSVESDAAVALVFRGVDTTTPIDVTSTSATGSSTNPDPAAITPASNNCCVVAVAGSTVNDATPGSISGYSATVTDTANDTRPVSVAGAYNILTGGAGVAEDPGAYSTWSTGAWQAVTIALRAAVTTISAAADQSLSIGQSATDTVLVQATAAQSLGVQQSAAANVLVQATSTKSLGIQQTATDAVVVQGAAAQSLGIQQSATATTTLAPTSASADQSLGIQQSATDAVAVQATATQSLGVQQSATDAVVVQASATQSLGVQQSATAQVPVAASATQSLGIQQSATDAVVVQGTAAQSLGIAQAAPATVLVAVTATQSLGIQQTAGDPPAAGTVVHSLPMIAFTGSMTAR